LTVYGDVVAAVPDAKGATVIRRPYPLYVMSDLQDAKNLADRFNLARLVPGRSYSEEVGACSCAKGGASASDR